MPSRNKEKNREYQQKWYKANRKTQIQRSAEQRRKVANFARSLKEGKPCTDCGTKYPYYVMDWDHLQNKVMPVSRISVRSSRKALLEEIAKCELVCSNCHRERTYKRGRHK